MGCGRKAAEEDDELQEYRARLETLSKLTPNELLNYFDEVRRLGKLVRRETEMGTRYLFGLIDDLTKLSEKLP